MGAAPWNCNIRGIQRLGVNQAVYRVKAEFAKLGGSYIAGGQCGFGEVLSGTSSVVVIGQYIGGGGRTYRQGGCVARYASSGVADYNAVLRTVIESGGWRYRVVRKGRATDRRVSLLPLVIQTAGAHRLYRKRYRLACRDALVRGLGRNCGRRPSASRQN